MAQQVTHSCPVGDRNVMDLSRGGGDSISLETTTIPILLNPQKTALVVVDVSFSIVLARHVAALSALDLDAKLFSEPGLPVAPKRTRGVR